MKKYLQQYRVDFNQTFAVVIKPKAFCVFFAIAAFYDQNIEQMDANTTSLYGLIVQLIYIEILKRTKTKVNQNMVCKLLKVLYSLKQSLCLWYKKLLNFLL